MNQKFCMHCGARLSEGAAFCTKCGTHIAAEQPGANQGSCGFNANTQQTDTQQGCQPQYGQPGMASELVTPDKARLTPGVAALVSVLIVGLGQMINGQLAKGLIMLFGGMFAGALLGAIIPGLSVLFGFALWIISGIDAYQCAKKLQSGQAIPKFSFF